MRPLLAFALWSLLATVAAPTQTLAQTLTETDRAVADAREVYIQGDYVAGLAVLIPAADAGHMRAQNLVGASYQYGQGVPVDAAQALRYFNLSAGQTYPPALHNLGYLYETGMEGLVPDPVLARDFYARAAALDYAPSIAGLARMQVLGLGGPLDEAQALRNFNRAAELGDKLAFEYLGWMYRTGTGVAVDEARARENLQIAGLLGLTSAFNDYGLLLEMGQGGPVDLAGAMAAYQLAIADDNPDAAINAAWLIFENPDQYPDQVQGLAFCYFAVAHSRPEDLAENQASCNEVAAGYSETDRRLAQKAAAAM